MAGIEYYNLQWMKAEGGNQLAIKGEVTNRSGKHYNAVSIRVILFSKNIPIVSAVIVVNGLAIGRTKDFEKKFDDLDYEKVATTITRYDVYTESAY
ncbi:MAG: FxLYD domain-containing protein [Candidatus Omnitrophica bacterium]|nr:FxLYD domain-containing protein [Candidatus Omnitrophota bacterium]